LNWSELEELLPGILPQLGADGLETLRKLASSFGAAAGAAGADDEVPELGKPFFSFSYQFPRPLSIVIPSIIVCVEFLDFFCCNPLIYSLISSAAVWFSLISRELRGRLQEVKQLAFLLDRGENKSDITYTIAQICLHSPLIVSHHILSYQLLSVDTADVAFLLSSFPPEIAQLSS
jgi:hypothetical protein